MLIQTSPIYWLFIGNLFTEILTEVILTNTPQINGTSNNNSLSTYMKQSCTDQKYRFHDKQELKSFVLKYYPQIYTPTQTTKNKSILLEQNIKIKLPKRLNDEEIKLEKQLKRINKENFSNNVNSSAQQRSNMKKDKNISQPDFQVPNVEEADIFRTDGTYIYSISTQVLSIIQAYPVSTAKIISKINFSPHIPQGLFIQSDFLAVFGSFYGFGPQQQTYNTFIKIYNIKNKTNPILLKQYQLSGQNILQIRKLPNGFVYVITKYIFSNKKIYPWYNFGQGRTKIPYTQIFKPQQIYLNPCGINIATFNMLNIQSSQKKVITVIVEQSSTYVYMNERFIYLFVNFQIENKKYTYIHKIQIYRDFIKPYNKQIIEGIIQYHQQIDQKDNNLRILVTLYQKNNVTHNKLYIFNHNLKLLGQTQLFGQKKQIQDSLYVQDKLYITLSIGQDQNQIYKKSNLTNLTVQNMFLMINLENSREPKLTTRLIMPEIYRYLLSFDKNTVLGIGKRKKLQISTFNISKFLLNKIHSYELNQQTSKTLAQTIPYSVTHIKYKNYLVISLIIPQIKFNGVGLFNITNKKQIQLIGLINHMGKSDEILKRTVQRSISINQYLYTKSGCILKINKLEFGADGIKNINLQCPKFIELRKGISNYSQAN